MSERVCVSAVNDLRGSVNASVELLNAPSANRVDVAANFTFARHDDHEQRANEEERDRILLESNESSLVFESYFESSLQRTGAVGKLDIEISLFPSILFPSHCQSSRVNLCEGVS